MLQYFAEGNNQNYQKDATPLRLRSQRLQLLSKRLSSVANDPHQITATTAITTTTSATSARAQISPLRPSLANPLDSRGAFTKVHTPRDSSRIVISKPPSSPIKSDKELSIILTYSPRGAIVKQNLQQRMINFQTPKENNQGIVPKNQRRYSGIIKQQLRRVHFNNFIQ